MKRLPIICCLLLISSLLFAQHIRFNWQQCFTNTLDDITYDIIQSGNGYILLVNQIQPEGAPNAGNSLIWLQKLTMTGQVQWEKYYGSSTGGGAYRILKATDNDFYLMGATHGSGGDVTYDPYPDSKDYWIIKIDSSEKKYGIKS